MNLVLYRDQGKASISATASCVARRAISPSKKKAERVQM